MLFQELLKQNGNWFVIILVSTGSSRLNSLSTSILICEHTKHTIRTVYRYCTHHQCWKKSINVIFQLSVIIKLHNKQFYVTIISTCLATALMDFVPRYWIPDCFCSWMRFKHDVACTCSNNLANDSPVTDSESTHTCVCNYLELYKYHSVLLSQTQIHSHRRAASHCHLSVIVFVRID